MRGDENDKRKWVKVWPRTCSSRCFDSLTAGVALLARFYGQLTDGRGTIAVPRSVKDVLLSTNFTVTDLIWVYLRNSQTFK